MVTDVLQYRCMVYLKRSKDPPKRSLSRFFRSAQFKKIPAPPKKRIFQPSSDISNRVYRGMKEAVHRNLLPLPLFQGGRRHFTLSPDLKTGGSITDERRNIQGIFFGPRLPKRSQPSVSFIFKLYVLPNLILSGITLLSIAEFSAIWRCIMQKRYHFALIQYFSTFLS